jgi:hypothetical protein
VTERHLASILRLRAAHFRLLLGASLFAYAMAPSIARAQQECGPPPPGGGTVTCPAGNYPNGIRYDVADDLTVVLDPGVTTAGRVALLSFGAGTDLALRGPTNTSINSTLFDGVIVFTSNGTASVIVDRVAMTGNSFGQGVAVFGGGGAFVTANTIITSGTLGNGIGAGSAFGPIDIHSGSVITFGDYSIGIWADSRFAGSGAPVTIESRSIQTAGRNSPGISAPGASSVAIVSGSIATAGADSDGILATSIGGPVSVTSHTVDTSGNNSAGISASSGTGTVTVASNRLSTTGADSPGVVAVSDLGTVAVDVNSISATGAGSAGIVVDSGTTSTVTIRGLVQSTDTFEVQAHGGAATVNTTATGIIRGQVSLTGNADRVDNAGQFDAIGTSFFGAGADAFNNSGAVTAFNGTAVFAGLETFTNAGRIDLRDGAVGDTLNVTGAFIGGANGRLGVDASIATALADVLITGVSSGSTTLDVNLIGPPVFSSTGTLVVDAAAGTSASAFALVDTATTSPLVKLRLVFDAPNNDFLLLGIPDQPVFESIMAPETLLNFWNEGGNAVAHELEVARDGMVPDGSTDNLLGERRWGGWVQLIAANLDRDSSQSQTIGGATTVFDTSYDQDYEGVQGGIDYQSGGAVLGLTFGLGRSDVEFDASFNRLDLDGANIGVYGAFHSGNFYFNAVGKIDWIEAESEIGAGLAARFDATAWGLRANTGFRLRFGDAFIEPSASLAWVNVDIDGYSIAEATVSYDDFASVGGSIGIRVGADFQIGRNAFLSPYLGIQAVEEFEGDARNAFTLGRSIFLEQDAPGSFGALSVGATLRTGSVEAFIGGELRFGSELGALAGRAGGRMRF